jgi:hypothetical protein
MSIQYIHNERPEQVLEGDVLLGKGFMQRRGVVPRIYIATTKKAVCCMTQHTGKGRLVQYLLDHLGNSIDRETLREASGLKLSTVVDYMSTLRKAFTDSNSFELHYDFNTKRYTLVERKLTDFIDPQPNI